MVPNRFPVRDSYLSLSLCEPSPTFSTRIPRIFSPTMRGCLMITYIGVYLVRPELRGATVLTEPPSCPMLDHNLRDRRGTSPVTHGVYLD